MVTNFYQSEEWNEVRKAILKMYGIKCMKCGATNCEMHVDHIKPRSLYPELELCLDNLQVLCKDCNMEKSNKNFIDCRPKPEPMFREICDIIPGIIFNIDFERSKKM